MMSEDKQKRMETINKYFTERDYFGKLLGYSLKLDEEWKAITEMKIEEKHISPSGGKFS
jgi:hypothetical protein